MSKVAIITGGASGMGLAVATALSKHQSQEWTIHILDMNATQGTQAASSINATFHDCNVADYTSLSSTFNSIYQQHKRVDFVHANAGIAERFDFMTAADGPGNEDDTNNEPPPPPDMKVIEINLKGVIITDWLALHYFHLTKKALGDVWEGNLVMTASMAGLYATYALPMYTAAKYGVIGLTRSLAPRAYHSRSVRVNCICPGLVQTGMTAGLNLGAENDTPIENIVAAVFMLIEGSGAVDSVGVEVEGGQMYGRAVEVSRDWFRFREMPEYPDEYVGPLLGDVWRKLVAGKE